MQFDDDEIPAMPLRWKQWLGSDHALLDWSQAAQGLIELFPGWPDGEEKKGFPKLEKNGTLRVQLQKPMPGIHIIAFKLPNDPSDFTPSVDLRVWVNEKHPEGRCCITRCQAPSSGPELGSLAA